MAASKAAVRFTANFESNLASIEAYWRLQNAPQAYANLLDQLAQNVISNLEQHARLGRLFLARSSQSQEVRDSIARLRSRLGSIELREYLVGDYLILYGVDDAVGTARRLSTVYLFAIRHQRQLSFDFDGFWHASRADAK